MLLHPRLVRCDRDLGRCVVDVRMHSFQSCDQSGNASEWQFQYDIEQHTWCTTGTWVSYQTTTGDVDLLSRKSDGAECVWSIPPSTLRLCGTSLCRRGRHHYEYRPGTFIAKYWWRIWQWIDRHDGDGHDVCRLVFVTTWQCTHHDDLCLRGIHGAGVFLYGGRVGWICICSECDRRSCRCISITRSIFYEVTSCL